VRSAKRCRHCILGYQYSVYLRLESQNLTRNPSSWGLGTLYTEHCVNFWDACFELAEYIKPKIQRPSMELFLTLNISLNLKVHLDKTTEMFQRDKNNN
jgi:hypothetical protein